MKKPATTRVLIPKVGQPGKFRPLGIPTVVDRVVASCCKILRECSTSGRAARAAMASPRSFAIAAMKLLVALRPRSGA